MKKGLIIIIFFAIASVISTNTWAGEKEPAKTIFQMSASHRLSRTERTVLENRVKEIRKMDLDHLTAAQKEELKTELLLTKEKLSAEPFTGIYLSAGAIIIILLILLIIT